jgi:hypothetical protein
MMKHPAVIKKIIILSVFFNAFLVNAQFYENEIPITGSYFGETLLHPGIYLGSEWPVRKNLVVGYGLGTYLHCKHHLGLFLSGDFSWRKTFRPGYTICFGLGIGYLHTWPHGGKIYSVDENGNIESVTNWGQPSVMPSLKLGLLGWDFRQKTSFPCRIFADVVIFGQYPYNDYIMPHAALSLGATYYLKRMKHD